MRQFHLGAGARIGSSIGLGLLVAFMAGSAFAAPFDITDTTPRAIVVDTEASADPIIVGTSGGASFPGGAVNQIVGAWTSDGVTGTITFTAAALEALFLASPSLAAFPVIPGSTSSTFTIDIASGNGSWDFEGGFDFDSIPPAVDTLTFGQSSSGGPYLPLGIVGSVAGYEEDFLAPGVLVFCTDVTTFIGAPGGCGAFADGGLMTFGPPGFALVPAYAYIPASGLLNMTGNVFASTSSAPTWSGVGDVRLSEVPPPVPGLGPWGMIVLALGLAFVTVGVLRLRGTAAGSSV
ncbi:MAG: hypothetical protein ABGX04_11020 [Myxococcales bacterium]|nr:hypothetical protein [Myxococcales bacterium]